MVSQDTANDPMLQLYIILGVYEALTTGAISII